MVESKIDMMSKLQSYIKANCHKENQFGKKSLLSNPVVVKKIFFIKDVNSEDYPDLKYVVKKIKELFH